MHLRAACCGKRATCFDVKILKMHDCLPSIARLQRLSCRTINIHLAPVTSSLTAVAPRIEAKPRRIIFIAPYSTTMHQNTICLGWITQDQGIQSYEVYEVPQPQEGHAPLEHKITASKGLKSRLWGILQCCSFRDQPGLVDIPWVHEPQNHAKSTISRCLILRIHHNPSCWNSIDLASSSNPSISIPYIPYTFVYHISWFSWAPQHQTSPRGWSRRFRRSVTSASRPLNMVSSSAWNSAVHHWIHDSHRSSKRITKQTKHNTIINIPDHQIGLAFCHTGTIVLLFS